MKHKGYEKAFSFLKPNSQEIHEYVGLFLERFNYTFEKTQKKLEVNIYHTNQLIGLFFKLVIIEEQSEQINYVKTKSDELLHRLSSLGNERITDRLFIQKDIRGFEKNGFYIVKPNEKILWHKAIAQLDLNEFSDAILTAGKKHTFNVR